jgi:hypothetical protein
MLVGLFEPQIPVVLGLCFLFFFILKQFYKFLGIEKHFYFIE